MIAIFTLLSTFATDMLHIHTWRDFIEIFFFSTLTYYFLLWLRNDTQKNLIFYFYGYCTFIIIAQTLNLSTISFLLFNGLPACVLIFFTVHQETLQKNFIALQTINPLAAGTVPWLEELMRISLSALNKKRELIIIIERKDSLAASLRAPYLMNADLKKGLLDLFLEVENNDEAITLWVSDSGKLIASPVTWNFELADEWIAPTARHIPTWKQNALFITQKKDTLVMHLSYLTRSFDLIVDGKLIEQLTAPQVFNILKQITSQESKGKSYVNNSQKHSYNEINP